MTLRELRKAKYRTIKDFADKLEMPMFRVEKWEVGLSAPKIKDLPKVAKALGVSVNTLVKCFEQGE